MNLIQLKDKMVNASYEEEYINKVIEYAENIQTLGYNVIFDIRHLSRLTGINASELYAYYMMKEKLYKEFTIPKTTGGYRYIVAPSENLKFIQRWILDHILKKVLISNYATGFVSKRSIVTNAKNHIGKECVVNLDIKDFFPSITYLQVYTVFKEMGYTEHLSMFFSGICTHNDVLPQGAPTSPYLSNVVCKRLDQRLSKLASHIGADYSRYADDITLSGTGKIARYISLMKKVIKDEGFEVNNKKVRVHYQHHRQMVTGLIVNEKLSVPRETKQYLRQQIYYSKKFGVTDNLAWQEVDKTNYKDHLYGLACFVKMVEKPMGEKFLLELNQIDWES